MFLLQEIKEIKMFISNNLIEKITEKTSSRIYKKLGKYNTRATVFRQ